MWVFTQKTIMIILFSYRTVSQNSMSDIAKNWENIQQRIARAAKACQRDAKDIEVVAVSKTQSPDIIREAFALGIHHFAENYLQEALPKLQTLQDLAITWHFIGHLQSNKASEVAKYFHWVHSIDNLKLIHKLQQARADNPKPLQCCVQVNIDHEDSKTGVSFEEAEHLCRTIIKSPALRLRGLMCIPQANTADNARNAFLRLASLQTELSQTLPYPLDTLSMGMSADFETAIAAGATHIRLGQALLGARHDRDK